VLEAIRVARGSYRWAGLYQQRPSPPEGGLIKRDWFKRWTELPEKFDEVIQSWDLTFSGAGSSYVVGQVWGRAPHSNGSVYRSHCYLLYQVRERISFSDTIKRILAVSERYPDALTKVIEDKANGPAVISALKDVVSGIVAYTPRGSKESRLAAVSGLIEAGNVYVPANSIATWADDFVEEVVNFPNAANDDCVDAMTMALDRLARRGDYRTDFVIPDVGQRPSPWSV